MEKRKLKLTPLDHLMPRSYVVKLLYFPRSNPDIVAIASSLKAGLKSTFDTLPILSGTVQLEKDPQRRQEGALCVDAPWLDVNDIFVANDLTHCEDLVYADLKRDHFPMTTTERYNFYSVLFMDSGGIKRLPAPVMMAQVNFIRGGMVLAQCLHHSFMDGPGGVTVMGMWAAFCRGEDGANPLTESMWDRSRLMQGDEDLGSKSFGEYLDSSRNTPAILPAADSKVERKETVGEGKEHHSKSALQADNEFEKQKTTVAKGIQQKKEVDTEIFFFSHARLAALKAAVSAALPREDHTPAIATPAGMSGESTQMIHQPPGQPNNGSVVDGVSQDDSLSSRPYISTNDALCALLFSCVTVARSSTLASSSSNPGASAPSTSHRLALPHTVPLGITVSGRRLLTPPLPKTYIGNVTLFCHLNIPLPYLDPSTKPSHITPTSPVGTTPQQGPSHPPTPAMTPDIPTIASVAVRIRARLLELDEDYVRGLIGALDRVSDLAKVVPASRPCARGAGAGAPILGQSRDDGNDVSSTKAAGKSAGGRSQEGPVSSSSSPPSSLSWDLTITAWTTQAFYAMDWGAELLGGGHRAGLFAGQEAHDQGGAEGYGGGVRMGKCERVRIPKVRYEAMDGDCFVLPMLEGGEEEEEKGGLEVMIGLERGVMERLSGMEEWCRWAERRCS